MTKENKSLKIKTSSRRKFFKTAAKTGAIAAAAATAPAFAAVLKNFRLEDLFIFNDLFSFVIITPIKVN